FQILSDSISVNTGNTEVKLLNDGLTLRIYFGDDQKFNTMIKDKQYHVEFKTKSLVNKVLPKLNIIASLNGVLPDGKLQNDVAIVNDYFGAEILPTLDAKDVSLMQFDDFSPLNANNELMAKWHDLNDLAKQIKVKSSNVNSKIPGIYQVVYEASNVDNKVVFKTINVTVKPIRGQIEITKIDHETGVKLSEAKFEVRNEMNVVVDHVITDINGIAVTKELPAGNYSFVEIQAPKGYLIDSTPIGLKIDQHKQVIKKIITNRKFKGKIEIIKIDAMTKEKLEGAEFDIRNQNGEIVDHVRTDVNGMILSKSLAMGTYTLMETKAPLGYKLNSAPIQVSITPSNNHVQQIVENVKNDTQSGKIIVSKFDKTTGIRLSGMVFKLRDVSTGEERIIDMKEHNVIEITDVPFGQYELIEIIAPNGYELSKTVYKVDVTRDNDVQEVKVYDVMKQGQPTPNPTPEKREVIKLPDTGSRLESQNIESVILATLTLLLITIKFNLSRKNELK
ncbi:MAG: MSCRAMM family protein, partial [Culicoidibacterales bacterium]